MQFWSDVRRRVRREVADIEQRSAAPTPALSGNLCLTLNPALTTEASVSCERMVL
jgi:hypothetical protein